MKERPILFSGAMVRTILAGQKTQTRRVVDERQRVGYPHDEIEKAWPAGFTTTGDLSFSWACPYGQPGDRLWVRETWAPSILDPESEMDARTGENCHAVYAADASGSWAHVDVVNGEARETPTAPRWRPSIHMPRWASRLTLEVTEVRVQRLQDISEEDARAEGVEAAPFCKAGRPDGMEHVEAFEGIWQSINGERPGGSWADNPFVWAISFRRLP